MHHFRLVVLFCCLFYFVLPLSTHLHAQSAGVIEGTVLTAESNEPLSGVTLRLEDTNLAASTSSDGKYRFENISPATYTLSVSGVGRRTQSKSVTVRANEIVKVDLFLDEQTIELPNVIVSATGEAQPRLEVPATVGVIAAAQLQEIRPSHPSQIMGLVPGVWVNVTGGEGHMTAIRQPLTTNPVYLYLEDGVPTRSTGFFNHNALYEINVPMASMIEVTKGPGTALYGSDAIGGVINVVTSAPEPIPAVKATFEGGSFQWKRGLLSGGTAVGEHRLRADVNYTRTDGWRTATDYDRISSTGRWDLSLGTMTFLKTVVAYSNIDQTTAGSSAISLNDYNSNPRINYTPFSFRKVGALRISSALEHTTDASMVSITPYFRRNSMDILPNWSLSFDPAIWYTSNHSFGVLAKYRKDFEPFRTRVVVGVDYDYSPGKHREERILPKRTGSIYTSYRPLETIYDYDVTFQEIAPYLHVETSPVPLLRVTGGLRLDEVGYDYTTKLPARDTSNWKRPPSTSTSYHHLSPKLGMTYTFHPSLNLFASYNHGFRVPSEGQVFRQGSAINTLGLEPIKVDSYEMGVRGTVSEVVSYDVSLYSMIKRNDILSYRNPANGLTEAVNAGKTRHRGIEAGLGLNVLSSLQLSLAYSYAKHTYDEWVISGVGAGTAYSGKEMEVAPRSIGNARISYNNSWGSAATEVIYLGSYWMDPDNTHKYAGHALVNVNVALKSISAFGLYGKMTNIFDKRFAESASYTAFRGEEFAPGMPRTLYFGVTYKWMNQ